jgi:calcineurin-like phosphoesterase family protein
MVSDEDCDMTHHSFFLTADQHFNHGNIIRYCNRPFDDTTSMNSVLKQKWNQYVGEKDTIWFLGDLVMNRPSISLGEAQTRVKFWINQLNGQKQFIEGNHDYGLKYSRPFALLSYRGFWFFLTHDPGRFPWGIFLGDRGWVIHGHHHNNDLENYPFINGLNRTINVGVELTGYRPVSIDEIVALPLNNILKMETLDGPYIKK